MSLDKCLTTLDHPGLSSGLSSLPPPTKKLKVVPGDVSLAAVAAPARVPIRLKISKDPSTGEYSVARLPPRDLSLPLPPPKKVLGSSGSGDSTGSTSSLASGQLASSLLQVLLRSSFDGERSARFNALFPESPAYPMPFPPLSPPKEAPNAFYAQSSLDLSVSSSSASSSSDSESDSGSGSASDSSFSGSSSENEEDEEMYNFEGRHVQMFEAQEEDDGALEDDALEEEDDPDIVPSLPEAAFRQMAKEIVNGQTPTGSGAAQAKKKAASVTAKKKKPSMTPAAKKKKRRSFQVCEHCSAVFASTTNLRRHKVNVHLGLKPYLCTWPDCGYTGKVRYDVIRHIRRVHFGLATAGGGSAKAGKGKGKKPEMDQESEDQDANDWVAEDRKILAALQKGMMEMDALNGEEEED